MIDHDYKQFVLKALLREFGEQPAPEAPKLETLIKLQHVSLLNLCTLASVDFKLLNLSGNSFKVVLTAEKLKIAHAILALNREKFRFDAAEQALGAVAELKPISTSKLSFAEKIDATRRALFGELPEDFARHEVTSPEGAS